MDRYVGIDYGPRRTGVAASDPLGIFATALDTVDSAKLIDYIKNYATRERILAFVVGYPLNTNGRPSENLPGVEKLIEELRKAFPGIPVEKEDERFTSVLAHRAMIDGGMKYKDRRNKASVDKIAAAIILQGFLDRKNKKL